MESTIMKLLVNLHLFLNMRNNNRFCLIINAYHSQMMIRTLITLQLLMKRIVLKGFVILF